MIKFFSPSALEPFSSSGFRLPDVSCHRRRRRRGPRGPGSAPGGRTRGARGLRPGLRARRPPGSDVWRAAVGAEPRGRLWAAGAAGRLRERRAERACGAAHPVGGLRGPDSHLPGQSRCAAPAAAGADRTGSPLLSAGPRGRGGERRGGSARGRPGPQPTSAGPPQSRLSGSGRRLGPRRKRCGKGYVAMRRGQVSKGAVGEPAGLSPPPALSFRR